MTTGVKRSRKIAISVHIFEKDVRLNVFIGILLPVHSQYRGELLLFTRERIYLRPPLQQD